MPPKKKVEIDDSFSSSDDEVQKRTPKKKAVFRKPSPKKAATKPTTSTMNGDKPGSDNEEGRFTGKQGYSGQYDHEGHGLLNVPIPQMAIPVMSADGTGARLMIKEIIVTNFKSYYGTQRIGPFHKNFSAIIGPNGSGKSNVIDSLLFVFGFRASRIRLKKLKELIHNSSGKKQPDSCTVEVVFHKIIDKVGGDYEVIEGSEFTVGRTAYQDSTSKYTINGRNRSKDEIEKKLKEVGIDLVHNRFLILQGEVEQIALMKPKAESAGKEGMLEYLEDIIGSSRLKNFLSDIGLKLDELSTEKSQQNQRVKAAEKDRDALEGPVREMISHLRCENQATLLNNKLLTIKKTSYERVLAENMPTVDKLKEKLNTAAERLDEVLTQKKKAEKEFAHLESDKDGLQKTLGKLQKHITELEAKESRRKIDYKKCAKDLSNGKDKLATYEKELADLLEVPGKADANIKMLVGEIEELREKVASDEAKIEKNTPLFEEKSAKLRDLKQSAEEELGEKQGVANEIQQKQRIAQEELNLMMAGQQKVQGRLEDLQRQLEEIQNKGKEAQKKHDAARARLPECEKALDEARAAVPDMQQERNNLMRECDGLKAKLQDETSAMKQQSQGSRVDRLLGEARDRGELKTYFGRLGDMGAIDSKYDAAVTTTTAGLNSYVLQTKEDGDKALAMIKAAKIGRHTLLVLDAVAEAREYMNADPRRFPAPRVFDLLQIPDERMKKAFYNQFKDTMVVDSMEEARTIFNKHKGRYITLQGGVIDASGIISGGGKSRTGGMGSSVKVDTKRQTAETQDRIEGYKEQLNRKTAKLTELEDKIKKCDQTIYALNTEFNELRNTVRIQGNEANQQQQRVAPLEKQIAFTKDEVTKHRVDEALVAEKKESVKELNAEHEAAKRELTEAQDVFKKASDNLDRVWRELCGRFRETADSHKVDIAARETQIADQEGKKKSFEREKAKAEARLKTAEANVSDKTKLQEALKEDERSIEAELREKCDEKKEIEGNISEVDAQIKEARKSNSQNDEEENKLSQAMERLKDDLKSAKEEVQSLELEIKRVQKEISSLKLHRIKDYGVLPQKVRKVAEYDHHIDQETLEEERAHQKKIRKHHKSVEDSGDEVSDGDDGAVPVLTAEDVKDFDKEDLKFRLQQLQDKVRKNKDTVNMRIIGEYTEKVKKYNAESSVLQKLSELHSAHMKKQEEWKRVRLQEFMEGFSKIGSSLKEMYQMITLGGDAALDLKDSLDPFTEGISFMVRPPKKSWKNMENLSGGEKTLSSLSLVFALHHFRPTPLYVMDEIDAALDFRNVSIIGHYVKDRTKNAQFIIISLRNNMFELGDRLVGIYKTDDCTKNVVIDPAKVMEESLKFQKALKTVHQRELDQTMQANEAVEEEDNSVLPHGVHGRKRVSEESSVTDSKRHDHRLSPASDPGRRHRLPLRPASQDTTNQGDL